MVLANTMKEILLITKGHPFEREPFFTVFDAMPGIDWTHVEQPAAQAMFSAGQAGNYDAYVLYDMPGIRFLPDRPPEFAEPGEAFKRGLREMLDAGQGFVFLHHAIAGWPAWEEYAHVMGGRFLYMPGVLEGKARQDSGYRHDIRHNVRKLGDHPVTAGIPPEFSITDELYLYEVFDDEVEPLLASDYAFTRDNFYSAARVVGKGTGNASMFDNEGWEHENGSNLIGWAKTCGSSRIVYLQCGDGPVAYANEHFGRLIANAIDWVAQ